MIKTDREKLIQKIRNAFEDVKLEDGIGLWEAQGLDDYKTPGECKKLREKDETEDWNLVSLSGFYQCYSSPSFFDAKGMRFHLPIMLLQALDVFEAEEENLLGVAPDVEFHLTSMVIYLDDDSKNAKRMMEYQEMRFSLLDKSQIECVVSFLEYRMKEMEDHKNDYNYPEMEKAVEFWKKKLIEQ